MFTQEELHKINEDLFERMLIAGWLKKFTFTEGKGWHLGWTEKGSLVAIDLKKIRGELELGAADERPVIASILAHGFTPDPRSVAETINAAFKPFLKRQYAARAIFVHGKYCEVDWTKKGEGFCESLVGWLAELKIEMNDEDRLIALFGVADTWAPDENTKVVFE